MIAGRYPTSGLNGRSPWLHGLASFSVLVTIAAAGTPVAKPAPATPTKTGCTTTAPAPFAVVELYTSEFCGACPAADRLLSEIGADARKHGQRILPLAFHVDYFNSGDAVDQYSNAAFSSRQRAYAAALDVDDLYTPQMIVNGRSPFVGNERLTAQRQIQTALARPATVAVKVELERSKRTSETIRLTCDVQGASATSANLQIAVTERGLRGGHDNVVRVFRTVPLNKGSLQSVELLLPKGLNRKNASVVAFVQDSRTMAISGATAIDLEPAPVVQRVASAEK